MLKLRGNSGLRILYIGDAAHLDTQRMSLIHGLRTNLIVTPTLTDALATLNADARLSFSLNLVIFHIAPLAAAPHLALKILAFAPVAARILMYESPTDRAVIEMSPLFDLTWPRPDNRLLRPDALYWYRAGMTGTIRAFNEVPTAFVFVHRDSKAVLSANEEALQLLEKEGFDGGVLDDLIKLPAEAVSQESWRGDISLGRGQRVLGVSLRIMERVWLFLSLRDITDIEADREERRQEDGRAILGRAAAILAHEVSNPLAAIKSTLQLLGSMGSDFTAKEINEYVARALREIERLSAIVKSYLSIVRPAAKLDEVWSLKELIESAFVYMDDYLRTVGVECEVAIEEDVKVYFGSDQFKQIVWNIGKNAVDSMLKNRTASPRFSVRIDRLGKELVAVYFDDNGEGIDDTLAEKVFEPYFTSKGSSGTGLGLTICRMLAGRYKGNLELENREDGGARAILTMRVALDE